MQRETPDERPDEKAAWGSDVAAQMLRRLGFPYVSLNPGASFRGLHDSIVNHLGNEKPAILLCQHEDHAVAIAHGYAKATGEPMACVLHANVGLMHGAMALYNAYCDRVPMLVLGATGPVDAAKRRPWIDWIHTSSDQGGFVRSFVKWDDQPASPEAMIESLCRANIISRAYPPAPVFVCLDAGLQEASLAEEPSFPDLSRYQPPALPRAAQAAVEEAAAVLMQAKQPLILMGRCGLSDESWNQRVQLAERLGAVVMTDLKLRAAFPTDHPAHVTNPLLDYQEDARGIIADADVILALEWVDLEGTLRAAKRTSSPPARIISCSMDLTLQNGAHANYMGLAPADISVAATTDSFVLDLLARLPPAPKSPWREKRIPASASRASDRITLDHVAVALRAAFADPDDVTLAALPRTWRSTIWPFRSAHAYMGKDGGGGLGSGPGIAVGVATAMHTRGRHTVAVLGDGDFLMGASAIWTAVHARIPLLLLINNNRAYHNDEIHQDAVARRRNRPVANRWVGQRLENPAVDIPGLARSYGAIGIGPVQSPADLEDAINDGVNAMKQGHVVVIDILTEAASLNHPTRDRVAEHSAAD